jgi:hypothetical protein
MTNPSKAPDAARLLHELQHSDELKQRPVDGIALDPEMSLLRSWQSQRLAQTYADLLADPHTAPACRFFLSDIYGPRDYSQRDYDIARIHAFVSRVLPAQTVQLLTDAVELNRLTNVLDHELCRALFDQLGVTDTITAQQYAAGYRLCNNEAIRVQQIDLTTHVLHAVGAGARLRVVGMAMKVVRGPAQRAGWIELYDFLERGYAAFRQIQDTQAFVDTIAQRERQILDVIMANDT